MNHVMKLRYEVFTPVIVVVCYNTLYSGKSKYEDVRIL